MVNNNESNEQSNVTDPNYLKAPTYNSLVSEANELREKLRLLEESIRTNPSNEPIQQLPTYVQPDHRVPPDVDRNIPLFNGRETNYVADDWISSVSGVADLNGWNFKQLSLIHI